MEAEEKERIFRETHPRLTRPVDSISQEIELNARDAITQRDKEYSSKCNRKQWYIPYQNPNVKRGEEKKDNDALPLRNFV